MAYNDFLQELALAQGIASRDVLLEKHAVQYAFQIGSRERARHFIELLQKRVGVNFKGLRVLDVGCAYGSFSIELAKIGAKVIGIDINDKWLRLAETNARDEIDVNFLKCNAAARQAVGELQNEGPFDLFVVNDVFEHIYDTVGLLDNIARLSAPGAMVYLKIPNGMATRSVLLEGHKKVFGISLLAPDYWPEFVSIPFHIYYRRWPYFAALFQQAGFGNFEKFSENVDEDHDATRRFIVNDLNRIRRHVVADNFENRKQLIYLREAVKEYSAEAREDLESLDWQELHWKYRTTFWEGLLRRS